MKRDLAEKIFEESCKPQEPTPILPAPKKKKSRKKRKAGRTLTTVNLPKLGKTSSLNAEQLLARQEQVYSLRLDEGKTFREIAKIMGIGSTTAYADSLAVRHARWQGLVEREDYIKDESNERYDQLISKWLPLALASSLNIGETKTNSRGEEYDITIPDWEAAKTAGEMILKILKQREQLNGFHDMKAKGRTPQDIGEGMAEGVILALQKWATEKKEKPIQATIIDA